MGTLAVGGADAECWEELGWAEGDCVGWGVPAGAAETGVPGADEWEGVFPIAKASVQWTSRRGICGDRLIRISKRMVSLRHFGRVGDASDLSDVIASLLDLIDALDGTDSDLR